MSGRSVKITKNLELPEIAGSYHRIICMTGKNKGLCYYLKDTRVVMGRSPEVDIQVVDSQASREHIELARVSSSYVLTDLGSQNGVFVNDLKVSQHKLKNGDKIIIGTTVYKFSFLEVLPAVIEKEDEEDEEELVEIEEKKRNKKIKNKKKTPDEKRKKLIYIAIIGAVAVLMLPDEESSKKKKIESKSETLEKIIDEKPRSLKSNVEKEVELKVKALIHRGRREAREGNQFRAMEEFQMALMLDPQNGDASFHMNKAKQRLDEKIVTMNLQATKFKDALKFNQALGTYCNVYKLLIDYKEDARFKEAEKNIKDMLTKLDIEQDENYCN